MSGLVEHFRNYYGPEALDWFDVSYIGDWLTATLLWFVAGFIDHFEVFEREFSLDDPLISHPHKKQQISGYTNNAIALLVPLVFITAASVMKRSFIDLHHGALGLWVSRSLSHVITEFLKNRVGRLRPDFLTRCKWGEAVNHCTGKFNDILDGRKSFPSGHSSTAFATMTFLFLWLSAHTVAWTFSAALPPRNPWIVTSRMGRVFITLLPLIFATWVALSRLEDYRHHKEDVIVGGLIGILCGAVGYLSYWPNPFSHRRHSDGTTITPRLLYSNESDRLSSGETNRNDYELARLEEGSA
ncbi:lipid phosphate phosphatase 1 [Fomitiporia mediterranea MF3/22]|uniref:lipid phosphate phosphatase 1 n=1 Tax=Fomitiporia mediterranea (strain MF3/22) TaxID=694068 RepID=UPI0004407708|nr:lipid phosphate phosphatase 1 [Fomitiporia mediterranea MF3/22]EJD08574.1 lipid phosphate phosphatase 1 [Fomitiporia mediterranea MF3/22]